MLPQIEDAGQRAGLIQHFAPKIEDQMSDLESKLSTSESSLSDDEIPKLSIEIS